jgi:hypothetical protein
MRLRSDWDWFRIMSIGQCDFVMHNRNVPYVLKKM